MTHTLTTGLVDATPEEWFEALSQSPDLCAGLTVDVIQRMAARLVKLMRAANREAQPVGYISAAALDLLSHGQAALIHRDAETTTFIEEEYRDIVPLYAAPAVASGENCWSCGKFFTYVQHSECDGYCPHCNAPVDLDEEEIDDEA